MAAQLPHEARRRWRQAQLATAISLQRQCMEGEGRSARWCGWQRQKVLEMCKFWNAVDIQPEVLTLFNTPQMHKPHEPIDTLTDLPKWEAKWKKSWWLRPPALQYSQLWYPFPAPCTLRESGTRDPNLEDRFRVRSHVIDRRYWYCRAFHA